jgi:hypothetical protein
VTQSLDDLPVVETYTERSGQVAMRFDAVDPERVRELQAILRAALEALPEAIRVIDHPNRIWLDVALRGSLRTVVDWLERRLTVGQVQP